MSDSGRSSGPEPDRLRLFLFSEKEPWPWVPSHAVHTGALFTTRDGKFYEFVRPADEGWTCAEVPAERAGSSAHVSRIRGAFEALEKAVLAEHELQDRIVATGMTREARVLLERLSAERDRLQHELFALCNYRHNIELDSGADWYDRLGQLLPWLTGAFAIAVASFIVRMLILAPSALVHIATGAGVVVGGALAIGMLGYQLYKARNRFPVGEFAGLLLLTGIVALMLLCMRTSPSRNYSPPEGKGDARILPVPTVAPVNTSGRSRGPESTPDADTTLPSQVLQRCREGSSTGA